MTGSRTGGGWGRGARIAAALLCLVPAVLAAQNPPTRPRPDTARVQRPDTARRDTTTFRVPAGALPADTFLTRKKDSLPADSLRPAPLIPAYPQPDSAGFWKGTWVWDRTALQRFHGLSLLDLLVRIPGATVTRARGYGQPAGVAPFGLGGGRTRVFIDGWELDPLASATPDLQQLSLVDLQEVRVERRLDELRIDVTTFRLADRRTYSQLEAATGDPRLRVLRGLYSQAVGGRDVLFFGFDVSDTEGFRRAEPFSVNTTIARWSHRFTPGLGFQAEYRSADTERRDSFPESGNRRALILRGIATPFPGLTLEGIASRSRRSPGGHDLFHRIDSDQLAGRALLRGGFGWVEGSAQLRRADEDGIPLPTSDLGVRAGFRAGPLLEVQGSARASTLGGKAGTELEGSVRTGRLAGVSLFGSVTAGSRGIGLVRGDTVVTLANPDTVHKIFSDTIPLFASIAPTLAGFRAGAEWQRGASMLGAALLSLKPDRVAPFGLPLDRGRPALSTGTATGVEGYASIPLWPAQLRLEGWYTFWNDTGGHPYLPKDQGRVALEYHNVFYTGNLEPTLRVEMARRGRSLLPAADTTAAVASRTAVAYTVFNAFLQVRVIDVRAFIIAENLFNLRTAVDIRTIDQPLPGRLSQGTTILYGVRWYFRN